MMSTQEMLDKHADSLDEMVRAYAEQITSGDYAGDEPTVDDSPIGEAPYAVTDERGRPFSLLLAGGGPTFEVVAEGDDDARLEGYWGGDRVTRHGAHYNAFLDLFIER